MESKSIITKDIAKLVQTAVKDGCQPTPYVFSHMDSFRVGRVKVGRFVKEGGKIEIILYLDEDYDTAYAKMWRNDVGEVLAKELKKAEPKIFEIKSDLFTALVREIPSEKLDEELSRGMVHLKIVDKAYTIIKVIKKDETYISRDRYYDYDIEVDDEEEKEVVETSVPKKKDNNEPLSYELF